MIGGRRGPLGTLRGRIALSIAAGLLTAAIIFIAVAASLIRSQAQDVARQQLDRQTMALAATLGEQTAEQATRGEALQIDSQDYLEVIGGPRTRVYYSGNPLSPVARQPSAEIPPSVPLSPSDLVQAGVQRVEFPAPNGDGALEGAVAPVLVGDVIWGYLLLARPPGDVAPPWLDVAQRVLLAAALGLIVSLLLSLFLTARLTRPLRAMKAATHRVAEGNLRTQLGPTGTRELDRLAADFNSMVRELARRDGASREFLMRVTHDLRTPLTAIRGHAAALADGVVPDADVPRSLHAIDSEAGRLEELVADLLDLARLDARRFRLELSRVDLGAALAEAANALGAPAEQRSITLETVLPAGGLPPVVTDDRRVRQIVCNLIDNALRWSPAGGAVRLEARSDDDGVTVVVSDAGPGIDPADRDEVFTPFHSAEAPDGGRGSGLGLAISRELARALGGDLHVEDSALGGAAFVLRLAPVAPGGEEAAAPAPAPAGG